MKYWPFVALPVGYGAFVGLIALMLTGCNNPQTKEQQANPVEKTTEFSTICLDGVQYWWRNDAGGWSYFAPRYNAQTGKIVQCENSSVKLP